MRELHKTVTVVAMAALLTVAGASCARAEDEATPKAFEFREIRDGIYHAVGTGAEAVGCNGALIVSDRDVLVVDSHMTPTAGRALLREMKAITDLPVRYLVNTHFHFDHVHGNQAFGPDVEIIGHEFTYEKLAGGGTTSGRAWDTFIKPIPDQIAGMEKQLETLAGEERVKLEQTLAGTKAFWEKMSETVPTPPTVTLSRTMVLHRGGREIRLHFLGRGHTGGDVVVYLPAEKVLVSGDLLTEGLPYMGDGFFADWVETLDRLAELDVEVILPGHGSAFEETAKIGYLRDYLKEMWEQGKKLHAEGVPAAEAAKRIDMTGHKEHFPQIDGPGIPEGFVDRMYELLE